MNDAIEPASRDAFFENLAVLGFVVIKQRFLVHRLVKLAFGRINADLAEQRIQPERARFVGNDRHDLSADAFVPQQQCAIHRTNAIVVEISECRTPLKNSAKYSSFGTSSGTGLTFRVAAEIRPGFARRSSRYLISALSAGGR